MRLQARLPGGSSENAWVHLAVGAHHVVRSVSCRSIDGRHDLVKHIIGVRSRRDIAMIVHSHRRLCIGIPKRCGPASHTIEHTTKVECSLVVFLLGLDQIDRGSGRLFHLAFTLGSFVTHL